MSVALKLPLEIQQEQESPLFYKRKFTDVDRKLVAEELDRKRREDLEKEALLRALESLSLPKEF